MRYLFNVLVENKAGVLSRITGLISRRGFNIESLAVGPTNNPALSSMTIVVSADKQSYEQIKKQLNKLVCVFKVVDLTNSHALERELVLFQINVPADKRGEVTELANLFDAKIAEVGVSSMTIEATGDEDKLTRFTELLAPYGIASIIRTGKIALPHSAK